MTRGSCHVRELELAAGRWQQFGIGFLVIGTALLIAAAAVPEKVGPRGRA